MIGALILAAGSGSRFGAVKQLAALAGRPLLEHAIGAAVSSSAERVVVVLGAHADRISAEVDLQGAGAVVCREWQQGMSASLRTGLRAIGHAEAIVVLLGDQPFLSAAAIDRVIGARGPGASAVRASYGGEPGHPVLFESDLFGRMLGLRGDRGARELLDSVPVRAVACDGLASPVDIDTREELEDLASG